ncbi:nucleotidyltransferase domain-containing protein [bacterium]|jgi:uncharacterized protein|nr:nucleotidyltransferase domain-containing protein [bacterium]
MIEQDKEELIKIISSHLPEAKIILFGFRARQDNTPESDIDIALDNKNQIDHYILSCIAEDIDESNVPFTVDVVDLNNVSEDLKKQMLKNEIVWKKRSTPHT